MEEQLEDYSIYNEDGECIGEISIPKVKTFQDMPQELEIDGVAYLPQF